MLDEHIVLLEQWVDDERTHQLIYDAKKDEIRIRAFDPTVKGGWLDIPEFIIEASNRNCIPDFNEYPNSLRLAFTGRMSIVVELEDFDPMHIHIDDLPTTTKIVILALNSITANGGGNNVKDYPEAEGELLKHILNAGGVTLDERK